MGNQKSRKIIAAIASIRNKNQHQNPNLFNK